jgi:acyl-CoA synthetase (AMP-forming)/AMP-acid ligase II
MRLEAIRFGSVTDLVSGKSLTGAALCAEALRRAAILGSRGLGPGQAALITHGGTPDFFCDLLAVWQLGAIAACANPGLTRDELATVAGFLTPKLILAGEGFAHGQGLAMPILELKHERASAELSVPAGLSGGGLDDTALLLFTSGTTGAPKGVAHSYRSILARLALNRAHTGAADLARTLCVLPTHFGHGLIGNCLTSLFAGGDLYLHGAGGLATAAALSRLVDDHAISFMSSVPSFWKIALKAGKPPRNGSLARVHIGSAPLGADLWRQVMGWSGTDRVVNMYGITETANWVGGASAAEGGPEDGLIGRLWGGQAAILTAEGRLVAEGEGEILLQTPSLMQGYWHRADLTEAVLRAGWFHTGDIGRLDESGTLRLVGRQKDEINRAGMKINPAEIDLFLERHPQVAEACCFAMADEVSGEVVAAAIRTTENATLAPAELRAWCLERIRRELVPERWYLLPEIPKTDRGKINRTNVRNHCEGLKR